MANQQFICTVCGNIGNPKTMVKGSILTELFLWLFFILPGIFYSIWRLSTKSKVCSKCGSINLVPVESPVGIELVKKYHSTIDTSTK